MAARYAPVNTAADAQPLPEELAADLGRSANDIQTQESNLVRRREERENIRLTFEADIRRYQELRAVKPR
jgi:hypothetical protein